MFITPSAHPIFQLWINKMPLLLRHICHGMWYKLESEKVSIPQSQLLSLWSCTQTIKTEYELIYSGQDFTLVSMTVRIPKLMIQWTFQRICNQFRMSKSDIYRLWASTHTFENHIEVNDEEENVTWMNHTNLFLTILGHCA